MMGARSLAADIIYSHPTGPRSVATRAGDEVRGWEVAGVSPWSPEDVLHRLDGVLANLWRGVMESGRVAVWVETVRRPWVARFADEPPAGVAGDIVRLHRSDVTRLWKTQHFLFVVFRRDAVAADRVGAWLPGRRAALPAVSVDTEQVCAQIESALESAGGAVALGEYRHGGRLYSTLHEALAYLVTGTWQRQAARPAVPLWEAFATVRPLVRWSTIELRAAGTGKIVEGMGCKAYPHDVETDEMGRIVSHHIEANHLGGLATLACEWRVSQSVVARDRDAQRAQLERRANQKAGGAHDAGNVEGATAAASGQAWVQHDMAVFVLVDAPATAEPEAVKAAMRRLAADRVKVAGALSEANGSVVPHDLGLWGAWLGQQPGTFGRTEHPRRTLITADNFACLAPFWKSSAGAAAPLIVFDTRQREPFGFDVRAGAVPHGVGVGHTRTGKTSLMARIVAALRAAGVEQCIFDFLQASALLVWAMDGDYRLFTPGEQTGLAPLARPATDANVEHALRLFVGICNAAGERLSALEVEALERAVRRTMQLDRPEHRRPSSLLAFLNTSSRGEIARRLAPWVEGGVYGWVFDGAPDPLRWGSGLVGCDFTGVMPMDEVRPWLTLDLMHEIGGRLDGRRFVHHVDEGQQFYPDPVIGPEIAQALDTYAKLGAGLWTWTTDPDNAMRSPIGHTIASQCATKIATPNATPKLAAYGVDGLGFRDEAIEAIARASLPAREYVVQAPDACETIRFAMHGPRWAVARALMSGTRETVALVQGLRAQHGREAAAWLPHFTRWVDSGAGRAATILRGELG